MGTKVSKVHNISNYLIPVVKVFSSSRNNSFPTTIRRTITNTTIIKAITSISNPTSATQNSSAVYIGLGTFESIILKDAAYIDKTLLITELFRNTTPTIILTYPRRWGKSINLDMIKTFVEIEIDKTTGEPVKKEYCKNYKYFLGGVVQLDNMTKQPKEIKPLQIHNYDTIINTYLGNYPVIYIDFSSTISITNSFTGLESRIKAIIQSLYMEHIYLLDCNKVTDEQKQIFRSYLSMEYSNDSIIDSLTFLSTLLHQHFNQKVIILIDEYDTPITHALLNFNEVDINHTLNLFSSLFISTFKTNKVSLEKGLLTGVNRIPKTNLYAGLNNIEEYDISDSKFASYYGFTEMEVNELFNKYNIPIDIQIKLKKWYNGYYIGNYQIYNPWSILNVLKKYNENKNISDSELLRSYWVQTGTITMLDDAFRMKIFRSQLNRLLMDDSITFTFKNQLNKDDFRFLKSLSASSSNKNVSHNDFNVFFSHLFTTGYLTKDTTKTNYYKIPNFEIKSEIEKKQIEYYTSKYRISKSRFQIIFQVVKLIFNITGIPLM